MNGSLMLSVLFFLLPGLHGIDGIGMDRVSPKVSQKTIHQSIQQQFTFFHMAILGVERNSKQHWWFRTVDFPGQNTVVPLHEMCAVWSCSVKRKFHRNSPVWDDHLDAWFVSQLKLGDMFLQFSIQLLIIQYYSTAAWLSKCIHTCKLS